MIAGPSDHHPKLRSLLTVYHDGGMIISKTNR